MLRQPISVVRCRVEVAHSCAVSLAYGGDRRLIFYLRVQIPNRRPAEAEATEFEHMSDLPLSIFHPPPSGNQRARAHRHEEPKKCLHTDMSVL